MAVSDIGSTPKDQATRRRDLIMAVYIGVLAALLIVSSVGVNRARDFAANLNIEVNNLWAFFQAKSMRRTIVQASSDNLELMLLAMPDMRDEVRQKFKAKIDAYAKTAAAYRSDPSTAEGGEQLAERAKGIEQARDKLNLRRSYFEYARSSYQMSIVVAAMALISGSSLVLYLSGIPALLGCLMLFGGFSQPTWLP
jgi:hypothetical protein